MPQLVAFAITTPTMMQRMQTAIVPHSKFRLWRWAAGNWTCFPRAIPLPPYMSEWMLLLMPAARKWSACSFNFLSSSITHQTRKRHINVNPMAVSTQ